MSGHYSTNNEKSEEDEQVDEMLLDEEAMRSSWALGNTNFLKQWDIKR